MLADEPVPVLVDTDITGDVDDVLALAMLHALADRGACDLRAVTISKEHPQAAPFVDAVAELDSRKRGNMLSRMKTTVDLPDELFVAAKKRAAELREPLRALIERGLRAELGRARRQGTPKRRTIAWVSGDGGLPPEVDVADRVAMHEWLRRQR